MYIQYIVAALHQLIHDVIGKLLIYRVGGDSVFSRVIDIRLLLIYGIVSCVHDSGEVAAIHSACAKKSEKRRYCVAAFHLRTGCNRCRNIWKHRNNRNHQSHSSCRTAFQPFLYHRELPPVTTETMILRLLYIVTDFLGSRQTLFNVPDESDSSASPSRISRLLSAALHYLNNAPRILPYVLISRYLLPTS